MVARKINVLILLVVFTTSAFAQKPVLKRKIDYKAENEALENVLLDISDIGGFSFSYNPDLLPVDSLMSLTVENSSVKDVMQVLLGQEMELKISANHLVILKSKYSPGGSADRARNQKSYTINGYVRNSSSGGGVARAMVYDVTRLNSTLSDSTGFFSLEVSSREETVGIAIAKQEYLDTAVVIQNGDQNLDVDINPIPSSVEVSPAGGYDLGSISKVNNLKVVRFVTPSSSISYAGNSDIYSYKSVQASFLPFLGTNLKMSGSTENNVSLNILAGYNGATNGVEIGGLVNINRYYAKGVQVAGLGNIVGEETVGVQVAGLFNTNMGNVEGIQIAGISNLVLDSLRGIQISGISNVATQNVDGFQISGISNVAAKGVSRMQIAGISNFGKDIDGAQVSGIFNTSYGTVKGVQVAGILNTGKNLRAGQVAGIMNIATDTVKGVQIAGIGNFGKNIGGAQVAGIFNTSFGTVKNLQVAGILNTGKNLKAGQLAGIMNVAVDTVSGVQIAAILNFARVNKGFQLGLININDTVPGTSIGLLNLVWKGYNKVEIYSNEVLYMSARVKLGTRRFYSTIGFGTQGFSSGNIWGYTYGIGGVIKMGKSENDLNIELTGTDLQKTATWFDGVNLNLRFNVHYAHHITKRLMVFGGPTWSNLFYAEDKLVSEPYLKDIPPYTLYDTVNKGTVIQGWIGFEFGLRLL